MTAGEIAKNLFHKIENAAAPIGVFVIGDYVKSTKITTALFADACMKKPETLMGVYDADCRVEWLEEDLIYMGK